MRKRATQTLRWAQEPWAWLPDAPLDCVSLGRAHLLAAQRGAAANLAPAASCLKQAVDGLRRARIQDLLPHSLLARASLHTHTGAFDLARKDLDEAFSIATRYGFRLHEADAHLGYARLSLAEGAPAITIDHLAKARAIVEATGYHRRDGELAELDAEAATMARSAPLPPPTFTAPPPPPLPPAPSLAKPMPPAFSFPRPLVDAYRHDKLALFVGSGLSLGVPGNFPIWSELPQRLLDACERYDRLDLETLALKRKQLQRRMRLEQMLSELGTLKTALDRDYQAALDDVFRPTGAAAGPAHHAVAALGVRVVLTTNYDLLFEELRETPLRQMHTWKEADRALADVKAGRHVLLKVHGTAPRHETVVMSDREYDAARADASYQAVLGYLLQDHVFLFLGYGMNDPLDLDLALGANADAFKSAARRHYVLLKSPSDGDCDRIERAYNVRVLPYAEHAELPAMLRALATEKSTSNPP